MTRTIKIKSSLSGVFLTHPLANPGEFGDGRGYNYAIEGIPETVTDLQVLRIFDQTADCTWLGKGPGNGRHVFQFSELAPGRLIFV
jgi:hypothetical protein